MLTILSNRIRTKINKNFMRVLDACYYYYEYITYGKKITDDHTIGDLLNPIIADIDKNLFSDLLLIKLSDFRNSKLLSVDIDAEIADEVISILRSRYISESFNSGHNMMDLSFDNLMWKLDISDDYAIESNKIIQFNETNESIDLICENIDGLNNRHVKYSKVDPRENPNKIKKSVNDFDYKRTSGNIYTSVTIGDKQLVEVNCDGSVKVFTGDAIILHKLDHNKLVNSMSKDKLSTYIDNNHIRLFTLENDWSVMINLPYGAYKDHKKLVGKSNVIMEYGNSTEFSELMSHNTYDDFISGINKSDSIQTIPAYTNGHRVFTNDEIYMARNELTRVERSSHFDESRCTGVEYELEDSTIHNAIMPDGTLSINTCSAVSDIAVKINDRIYAIIRDVNTDTNYLAWTDDRSAWMVITPLPDDIVYINATLCNEYYIVFTDIGYTWAYSLDLSKKTIS